MTQVRPRMTHLFAQLGLDSSAEGIAQFIHEHQLPKDVNLMEAPYWSDAQRQFLAEKLLQMENGPLWWISLMNLCMKMLPVGWNSEQKANQLIGFFILNYRTLFHKVIWDRVC